MSLFKNKRAVLKSSVIILGLIALSAIIVYAGVVIANTHTAELDLDPEWSAAGQNTEYDMNLHNNGPDSIDEIRIFKNPEYSNFNCEEVADWTLVEIVNFPDTPFGEPTDMCWYYTGTD